MRDIRVLVAESSFVTRPVFKRVTGSTNDDLSVLAASGAPAGTVVVADAQTAGRGRLDRSWHSAPDVGLYLSSLFRPARPAEELPRWTLAASVAACEACREVASVEATIKWPNDVLAGGRKLAGILAEARSTGRTVAWLVVGAGFNVNHAPEDFPPELRDQAVSLRNLRGGLSVDRGMLARAYLDRLHGWAAELEQGRFEALAEAWHRRAPGARGTRVRSTAGEGITRGIDDSGALLVETADGSMIAARAVESWREVG